MGGNEKEKEGGERKRRDEWRGSREE